MPQHNSPPKALFLGLTYAGNHTRFLNLRHDVERDLRIQSTFSSVTGWKEGGLIERIPVLPHSVRGRVRGVIEASALARFPRPDVIWTAVTDVAVPHLWSLVGPLRRPLVLDLDWTHSQGEELAPIYFNRPPKSGLRRRQIEMMEQSLWNRVSLFTPWSGWAADGLRKKGVAEDRIMTIPPGVDLKLFQPEQQRAALEEDAPVRLLFVGGDFERKGGLMLLEALRGPLSGKCVLE